MENYKVLRGLGQGMTTKFFKAEQKRTGQWAAVRKFKRDDEEGVDVGAIREIKILQSLRHEHILGLLDAFLIPNWGLALVYEWAETDLSSILTSRPLSPISPSDTKQHLRMLLLAVEACHQKNILHGNLRPETIRYLPDGTLKLAGFENARFLGEDTAQPSVPLCMPHWYKSPELLMGATEYSLAVDMWSVGCIFTEFHCRTKPLLNAMNEDAQLEVILQVLGTPSPIAPLEEIIDYPPDAISLLKALLALDPNQRISVAKALQHPYFFNDPPPTPRDKLVLRPQEWVGKENRSYSLDSIGCEARVLASLSKSSSK